MILPRLHAGRSLVLRLALGSALGLLASGWASAAGQFPFDQELLLDAAPMRPAKRMPLINIAPDGKATLDLWCKTVAAQVDVAEAGIKIAPDPLPEALPQMMGNGQCSPERMQADQDLLAAFSQVTGWRSQGNALVLEGPKTLKFRPATN
jgi:heat shock protein HslJ